MIEPLPGDENAKADVESGIYEKERKLTAEDRVLDIGAHIGFFTHHAASIAKEVWAFEPEVRNYYGLCQATIWDPNATCLPFACSDSNRLAALWHNHLNSGGHGLSKNGQHDFSRPVFAIDTGEFLAERIWCPTFVKMDCEGSEFAVLLSIFKALTPELKANNTHFAFEAHSNELYNSCRNLLEHHGWYVTPAVTQVGVCYASRKDAA